MTDDAPRSKKLLATGPDFRPGTLEIAFTVRVDRSVQGRERRRTIWGDPPCVNESGIAQSDQTIDVKTA